MLRRVVVVACISSAGAALEEHHRLRGFTSLSSILQPGAVGRTLARVEEQWQAQAIEFKACVSKSGKNTTRCHEPQEKFAKSCFVVARAVLKASSGDRVLVKDYMSQVCGQREIDGWRRDRCNLLGFTLNSAMGEPTFVGRPNDVITVCSLFWEHVVGAEEAVKNANDIATNESVAFRNTSLSHVTESQLAQQKLTEQTEIADTVTQKASVEAAKADADVGDARSVIARAQAVLEGTKRKHAVKVASKKIESRKIESQHVSNNTAALATTPKVSKHVGFPESGSQRVSTETAAVEAKPIGSTQVEVFKNGSQSVSKDTAEITTKPQESDSDEAIIARAEKEVDSDDTVAAMEAEAKSA